MLEKLTILNGELSVKFDPLNTRYTVNMTTQDKELQLELDSDENSEISIFNNNIEEDQNEVVITVYSDEQIMSYYLEVYPMKSENVLQNKDYFASLEVKTSTYTPKYVAPLIAVICFLIILFLFAILFKKKKKY